MDFDQEYEKIFDLLCQALEGQEVEDFKHIYQLMNILAVFHIIDADLQMAVENFILNMAVRVYDCCDDEFSPPICKPYEFAKLIYSDVNLEIRVQEILMTQEIECSYPITPKKLQFLKEALHYAKNFHPGYLPEHLLER